MCSTLSFVGIMSTAETDPSMKDIFCQLKKPKYFKRNDQRWKDPSTTLNIEVVTL